ncbi:MAG: CDP-alcohol phosphatidyltransferase family protein [Pseudomonadota bacterium]
MRPVVAFAANAAALVVLVAMASYLLAPGATWQVVLPPSLFAGAMAIGTVRFRFSYPHAVLGACNAVTQIRAAIIAILIVPLLVPGVLAEQAGWVLTLALTALAMDGLDGWLARRAQLTSDFGARFDVEVDSVLAALLASLLLVQAENILSVAALLVLGFSRYAFIAATTFAPWLAACLPDRRSRKTICVIQIAAMIAVLGAPMLAPVLPLVAIAVLWSFSLDIRWLARNAA